MAMRTMRRQAAWNKTDGRCFYCGAHLAPDDFASLSDGLSPFNCGLKLMHVDHGVARTLGGGDDDENAIPSCEPCNLQKGSKTQDEYRLWLSIRDGVLPRRFFGEPADEGPQRDVFLVASPKYRGSVFECSVADMDCRQ